MESLSLESLSDPITIPRKEKAVVRPYLAISPAEERARALFMSIDPVKKKEQEEQRDLLLRQQLHEAKEREAKMRELDMHMRPQQYFE